MADRELPEGAEEAAAGAGAVALGATAASLLATEPKDDCWYKCGQVGGFCDFCGTGKACCRSNYLWDPPECKNVGINEKQHECVNRAPIKAEMNREGVVATSPNPMASE